MIGGLQVSQRDEQQGHGSRLAPDGEMRDKVCGKDDLSALCVTLLLLLWVILV